LKMKIFFPCKPHLKIGIRMMAIVIFLIPIIFLPAAKGQLRSPSGNFDAIHYEIRLHDINFESHELLATTTVWLTPLSGPVNEICLDLISLTVTAVWVDATEVTDFYQTDSLLNIPLTIALMPGDTVAVKTDYHGVPFHESWGGFHFSGEYAFNLGVGFVSIPHNLGKSWFPCIDNFTDRATYDVFCTLPEGKIAVAGGVLMDETVNPNGTITYHWRLNQAIPTYLASIAAGNYTVVRDTFDGINGQVPIDYYVRPQDAGKVAGTFVNLKDILSIFEDCMGPYSWDRVGYTGTAIGAMEHATNIFVPHGTITGNTTYESLMAHELTHMWMGDKVTCSSAEEMWINEGWATFFGSYYVIPLYGNESAFRLEMRAKHGSVLQFCHTPSGDGSYFPLNQIPQQYTYGMSAYDRGATVVQALRFYLGDSLFFETLKAFIDEFAFQHASSYDMRDFMSSYTGIDMSGFFDNFVLNAGTPHYSVDSFLVSQAENEFEVAVHMKQKRKGPAFTGNGNIIELLFMDNDCNRFTDTVHFNGSAGVSAKIVPFHPTAILVDPEEKMFDATTDNYKTIKTAGNFDFDKTFCSIEVEQITDSAFLQVTHNWAPPDSLKEHVPGLRLSDYRYWRIDGIVPDDFEATGKFFYSRNNYLDNTLIVTSADTLVILYRKGAAEDWQEIPFERIGPWNIGNIIVPGLKTGEYTLAVKEVSVGGLENPSPEKNQLKIYPNPSSDTFEISVEIERAGEIRIVSEQGLLVKSFTVTPERKRWTWNPEGLAAGVYFVSLWKENLSWPLIQKAVYLR